MAPSKTAPNNESQNIDQRYLGRSPVTIFAYDSDLNLRWVKNPPPSQDEGDFMELIENSVVQGVSRRTFSDAVRQVNRTSTAFFGECEIALRSGKRRFEVSLNPHTDDQLLGSITDLNQREPSGSAVRSLSLELAHRTKNLMAVISSLANQTARRSTKIADFTDRFIDQLGALSRAHDAIAATGWHGASLEAVVAAQIVSTDETPDLKLDLETETGSVILSPNAAQNIAIVLNELEANSKCAATISLSADIGVDESLEIVWRSEGPQDGTELWTELLDKYIPLSIDGRGTFATDDASLTYRLTVSSAHFSLA